MRLLSGLLFAGAAAVLFLGCGSTEGDGSSTITVRFVHAGQPVNVILGTEVNGITADGKDCGPPDFIDDDPRPEPGYTSSWPMRPEFTVNAECAKDPPTELTFMFAHELGPFFATVNWQGEDVSVDVEVPEAAVVAPDA